MDWIIITVIIMFLSYYMFGNSSSNSDEVCSFSFLKHPCRKTHHGHIPGWRCQDSSSCKVQTLNSLKVFGMCWRSLYRVLDSYIANTRSWFKIDEPLDGNNITTFIFSGSHSDSK